MVGFRVWGLELIYKIGFLGGILDGFRVSGFRVQWFRVPVQLRTEALGFRVYATWRFMGTYK